MQYMINDFHQTKSMWKVPLVVFLVLVLLPVSISYAQVTDKAPSLGIKLTNTQPFSYKDSDGKTVVLGEIKNTKNFPVTGVKVWVGFYGANGQLLESSIGKTTLDVIPAQGTSPFVIQSKSANSSISSISVNLLSFNSSPLKQVSLKIEPGTLKVGNQLSLSGKITNTGLLNSTKTKVHFISYDAFYPPRLVAVQTIQLNENLKPGSSANFEVKTEVNTRAVSFKLVAESNNYLSDMTNVDKISLETRTKLVTINDISLLDSQGTKLLSSDISVGKEVTIQSSAWIQYASDQSVTAQPYVYYVQIKQSGEKPLVEFIGMASGSFIGPTKESPKVSWAPQHEGLFYIETFVWDNNNAAIASPGPITLIHVKPQ